MYQANLFTVISLQLQHGIEAGLVASKCGRGMHGCNLPRREDSFLIISLCDCMGNLILPIPGREMMWATSREREKNNVL